MRFSTQRRLRRAPTETQNKWLSILFIVLGVLMVMGGIYLVYDMLNFQKTAQPSQGTVIKLEYRSSHSSNGSSGTYYPVIRWIEPNGKPAVFTGKNGSKPAAYDVGETVALLYNPQDPSDVRIDGVFAKWGAPVVAILGGVAFAIAGWFWKTQKQRTQKKRQWLQRHGRVIEAQVINEFEEMPQFVQKMLLKAAKKQGLDKSELRNDYLTATWLNPQTGEHHRFVLQGMSNDAMAAAHEKGRVNVLLDPKKPTKYLPA